MRAGAGRCSEEGLSRLHREHSWLSNTLASMLDAGFNFAVIYQVINREKNIRKIATYLKNISTFFPYNRVN